MVPMKSLLEGEVIQELAKSIEEAIRSTDKGLRRFVEPARGTLIRAKSKQHHIVFGRRGSGKTSLLRKAAEDLRNLERPIAYIDLETFKGESYPDILLNTLIESFDKFNQWIISSRMPKSSSHFIWKIITEKLHKRNDSNINKFKELFHNFKNQIDELTKQLHLADDITIGKITKEKIKTGKKSGTGTNLGIKSIKIDTKYEKSEDISSSEEIIEFFHRQKVDFLNKHVYEYRKLFKELSQLSNGSSYLFLDDLYHIRKADQAKVLDYFHKIAKDNNFWLKIGTIRYRTNYYEPGDPPIGLKITDDAEEIDLDLTLEKYSLAKDFLRQILLKFLNENGFQSDKEILTDGAINRLILCSGGVARDFLGIFRRSIEYARERGMDHRGSRICAEDVNKAAGEYGTSKMDELKQDTLGEETSKLEEQFHQIRDFCLIKKKTNLFLLDKDERGEKIIFIKELADLRLIHLINSRVTISGIPSKLYEVYMLDYSQYTGSRARRELDRIEFWKGSAKDKIRRKGLIYSP